MGVQLIRKAVCDRCGKNCSHITETIFRENVYEDRDIIKKRIETTTYHYTEMTLQGYDNRFECRKDTIILCGECVDSLGEWLKNKNDN